MRDSGHEKTPHFREGFFRETNLLASARLHKEAFFAHDLVREIEVHVVEPRDDRSRRDSRIFPTLRKRHVGHREGLIDVSLTSDLCYVEESQLDVAPLAIT